MGREARCPIRWPGGEGEATVLLETDVLVLRGALRRKVPRKAIASARVVGDALHLEADGETLALALGAETAARWLKALRTPPPTLGGKLGIAPGTRVHVVGTVDALELEEALRPAVRVPASRAELVLARVDDERGLSRAAGAHARAPDGAPLWVVHRKGRGVSVGEGAVRAALRTRGLVDTKVTSVSEALTAARYHRRSER